MANGGTAAGPVGDPGAGVVVARRATRSVVESYGGRGTLVTIGLFTVLFGGWAGIVPFVGPLFGYGATGTGAFFWDLAHALLWLVPGAASVLTGLVLATQAPGVSAGAASGRPLLVGFVTVLCGAWLVTGPFAWPVLEGAQPYMVAATPLRELSYWIGYSLGPGVILAMLGGSAMGASLMNRRSAARAAARAYPGRKRPCVTVESRASPFRASVDDGRLSGRRQRGDDPHGDR